MTLLTGKYNGFGLEEVLEFSSVALPPPPPQIHIMSVCTRVLFVKFLVLESDTDVGLC